MAATTSASLPGVENPEWVKSRCSSILSLGAHAINRPPIQEQAIRNARIAYSRLPSGDTKFQECVNDTQRTITEVLKVVAAQEKLFRKKRYVRILQRFNKHAQCLENLSGVIEVVVQTNASIGCPVWAPLKFILLVSYTSTREECASTISSHILIGLQ